MCIRQTPTVGCRAKSAAAPASSSACTSLITSAQPASSSRRIISVRRVSTLSGTFHFTSSGNPADSRRHSSSTGTKSAPGRVDSPPTSKMSAPPRSSFSACASVFFTSAA